MIPTPSSGKRPIEYPTRDHKASRVSEIERNTHYHPAILLPPNPSCLSWILRSAKGALFFRPKRSSLLQLRNVSDGTEHSAKSANENDARNPKRGGGGHDGKVYEHLTFLFLLQGLVLVKRFSDFLDGSSLHARLTRESSRRSVRRAREACSGTRRGISFRLALNEFM